ncbi:uncharacterized protein LOC144563844 [Carex rostrata]
MAKSPSPFSFLWQALVLPSKNPKLFTNIFLIYILSSVLFYISLQTSEPPLLSKPTFDHSNPKFTELLDTFKADTKELLIIKIVYHVFLFVISCFLSIITYYACSTAYLGEMLTLKELLNKVKAIFKGPVITHILISLFNYIYLVMFFAIIFIIRFSSRLYNVDISTSLFLLILLILLASVILFIYLRCICAMSMAISVIEPNLYGLGAISYATKLLKGMKMQVFLLVLAWIITSVIMHVCKAILVMFASGSKPSSLVPGFVYELLLNVVSLYTRMGITVLYYKCNQSN